MEALEDRTVPTVTLGTALGIGNESGPSVVVDVAADLAGNSYTTGYFSGTVDFDPAHTFPEDADIQTARGVSDIFIAKYASDSSLIWVKRMGGDAPLINGGNGDVGRSIVIDGSGNIYLAGRFSGSADFDSITLTSTGDGDADGFLAKLDSSGTVLWANRYGNALYNSGDAVGVDAAGNVYASVSSNNAPNNNALTGSDILKYSSTGSTLWDKWINTRLSSNFQMAVSTTGNVFVCGAFSGTVDFDPGAGTKYANAGTLYSGFALKLNTNGNFGWVSPFVGLTVGSSNGYSMANSIALDGSGNVIVGGTYRGPVDFNPGSGTTMLPTVGGGFITKLNSGGGLGWAKALESASNCYVNGLTVDVAGNIYASGSFNGTVDFDPGTSISSKSSAGSYDIFVLKLTSSGNYSWDETFGGIGNDNSSGIAVDAAGTIHLAGSYQGTVNFDPTDLYFLTNPGPYNNIFLVRLRQS
ncbi:MAG: SBBP repeat-containing protein [Gemmatales bacterium]